MMHRNTRESMRCEPVGASLQWLVQRKLTEAQATLLTRWPQALDGADRLDRAHLATDLPNLRRADRRLCWHRLIARAATHAAAAAAAAAACARSRAQRCGQFDLNDGERVGEPLGAKEALFAHVQVMCALLVAELAQLGDLGVAVRVADGLPGARGDLGLVLRLGLKIDEPTRAQKRLGKEAVHACEGETVQVPGASSLALERRDDHVTCLRGQGVDEGILRGAVGDA